MGFTAAKTFVFVVKMASPSESANRKVSSDEQKMQRKKAAQNRRGSRPVQTNDGMAFLISGARNFLGLKENMVTKSEIEDRIENGGFNNTLLGRFLGVSEKSSAINEYLKELYDDDSTASTETREMLRKKLDDNSGKSRHFTMDMLTRSEVEVRYKSSRFHLNNNI